MNSDIRPATSGSIEAQAQADIAANASSESTEAKSSQAHIYTLLASSQQPAPRLKASRFDRELIQALVTLSLICDCGLMILAFIGGFWICLKTGLVQFGVSPNQGLVATATAVAMATILYLLTLSFFGVYNGSSLLAPQRIFTRLTQSCAACFSALLGFTLVAHSHPALIRLSGALSVAYAVVLAILLAWRIPFHIWLSRSSLQARIRRRVLFVGWNSDAQNLVNAFGVDAPAGYEPAGYVVGTNIPPDADPEAPIPALGTICDIPGILRNEAIDIVVVSDDAIPGMDIAWLESLCEEEMVQLHLVLSCLRTLSHGTSVNVIGGVPVLGNLKLPLDRFHNELTKRTIDIIGATVGLILGAPLIAIFGTCVYLESPGPIFYRQCRLGWNGRPFHIIKIRSMRLDAEKDGVGWTTKDDPRRLAIGALLRKWNIDELPQFWNVLKGDMSLVGPRAERPELVHVFQKKIPHYNVRHSVRPGMSGWAQVNGLRGDTDLTERIRHDLYYIDHWSVLFDLKIMLQTFLICGRSQN